MGSAVWHCSACAEDCWPYEIKKFRDEPPDQCYEEATGNRALEYQRVSRSLTQMKGCLAPGFPYVFGLHHNTRASGAPSTTAALRRPLVPLAPAVAGRLSVIPR